jgi:hypothetical protein
LEWNGTHQLLVYAYSVNILGKTINIINKKTEALLDASRGFGLGVSTEKTKNMVISCHQNAGQYHKLLIGNKSFENVVGNNSKGKGKIVPMLN